ncbi:MAG: hypothetical protein AAF307_12730 [Pseudomonadota bacterium]
MTQGTANLTEGLQASMARTLEICELLESLADDLPRRPIAVWREAKHQCRKVLQHHITLGTEQIGQVLGHPAHRSEDQRAILLRFQTEYHNIGARLDDLDDLLYDAVSPDRTCIGAEALGYALRSHFDALRQHIGWENDVLLPMLARLVTGADLRRATDVNNPESSHA